MSRTIQTLLLAAAFFTAASGFAAKQASAAIFDTIDSVEPLMVIVAKKADTNGRMPAGSVSNPSKEVNATDSATSNTDTAGTKDSTQK